MKDVSEMNNSVDDIINLSAIFLAFSCSLLYHDDTNSSPVFICSTSLLSYSFLQVIVATQEARI